MEEVDLINDLNFSYNLAWVSESLPDFEIIGDGVPKPKTVIQQRSKVENGVMRRRQQDS